MKAAAMTTRFPLRLAALAALAAASFPALALQPFSAQYQANYMGMTANAQMQLASAGGDRWAYSLNIRSSIGEYLRSTTFDENGGRLRPLSHNEKVGILVKRKSTQAVYDWNARKATWSGDVKPERAGPVPLQAGDTNALLVDLQLVQDINAGKPLNYRTVDNGRAKPMQFVLGGKETLTVAGKAREATKATYSQDDKQIVVWVAADVPVPLRILQREDGQDSIDLRLNSWK